MQPGGANIVIKFEDSFKRFQGDNFQQNPLG
jgi:hypothetical protein